jgi:cyclopropane-fatty-acyl-phospholipid synthase
VLAALSSWREGHLTVLLPDGSRAEAGEPGAAPRAVLSVRRDAFFRKVALHGRLGLGESFEDGDWEADDLPAVLELGVRNAAAAKPPLLARATRWLAPRRRRNDRAGARANIRAHYDLGNEFYRLWLDDSMTYSAALFAAPDETLEAAQERKLEAVASQAGIGPGDRVLEIGCGWGSFAIHAARTRGCRVTALTISEAQHRVACERVRAAGLEGRVEVRLEDWRDLRGEFDRVVSIEMLEAVGRRDWPRFFETVDRVLAPRGAAVVQAIAHPDQGFDAYAARTDWIERYIFPGSLLASLGETARILARRTRLRIVAARDIAPHYARTLVRWRERFLAREGEARALGFDDRFVRRWTYYLAVCEAAFRARRLLDYQLVLARDGAPFPPEFPVEAPR